MVSLAKAAALSSCRAKIARADEHLAALYGKIDAWSDLQPCSLRRHSNADGSEHTFTFHVSPQPDVYCWALLMGDAVHNLRSALDHIVYSLAINHTGKNPPDDETKLAFPITSSPDKFTTSKWRIESLCDTAQTGIEKAQPYNRTHPSGWQPLWWLSQLDDIDKHRLAVLLPTAAYPENITIGAKPGTYKVLWNQGVYVEGAPVLRITLTDPNPDVYVDLNMTAAVVLKAEGQPPIGVIPSLKSIRREVVLICRYLSRFVAA